MAISFRCLECGSANTVEDDWIGLRVPCRQCRAYMTVPERSTLSAEQVADAGGPTYPAAGPGHIAAGPPPLPSRAEDDPDFEEDPRASGPSHRLDNNFDDDEDHPRFYLAQGWNTVRTGLGMMFWGSVALFLTILVLVCGVLAATLTFGEVGRGQPPAGPFMVLIIIAMGAFIIEGLVVFIGQCMCCAVPPESQVRGLVVGAVVCLLLAVALMLAMVIMIVALRAGNAGFGGGGGFAGGAEMMILPLLLMLAYGIAGILSHVLFIFFLRGVARFFRNESLAQSANGYVALFFITMGLYILLSVLSVAARDPALALVVGLFGFAILVMWIILIVWHLRLLKRTRDCISRAME